ncbi:hypothetical protein ABIF63_002554 [Bradyrhizobium japonicum]|uniref:Uncharacterized protein n=1 Tax=Bradyrhizobium japonicum TaxID=375 RepID=A0ABV2RND0_BRAJP|nr:hypothetical protein [Bradyrhizobium japonicum]MCS3496510.1 hypothetical protein [Bradyrhizobium japonicum]MCS3961328.1 hypothetical protein [Bradyrhizobium japonicum]MCS3993644.1 hypothetical protein [Bradyrhizobium japonicum]UQD98057.1 hypothetical protein JEY30_42635 [Bradyrhizobium japonicum]
MGTDRPALICAMDGVREHGEGFPVHLMREQNSGRLLIRAFNESGNNYTDVDLGDLVQWLRFGPKAGVLGIAEIQPPT